MINIAKIEAVAIEETIDVTIDLDGELYRFQVVVYETPTLKGMIECHYLDKYEKPLKTSQRRAIRSYLREYLNQRGDDSKKESTRIV